MGDGPRIKCGASRESTGHRERVRGIERECGASDGVGRLEAQAGEGGVDVLGEVGGVEDGVHGFSIEGGGDDFVVFD